MRQLTSQSVLSSKSGAKNNQILAAYSLKQKPSAKHTEATNQKQIIDVQN